MQQLKIKSRFTRAAMLLVMLLTTTMAWATDYTVTYRIEVKNQSLATPHAYFYNNGTNQQVCTWDNGIKTLWPANVGHQMSDTYAITFTPNNDLDKTNKNENNKTASTTAFKTETTTRFNVSVGSAGYYLKSVKFLEDSTVKDSLNVAPNQTSANVTIVGRKFFNYITVVLTDSRHYIVTPGNDLTLITEAGYNYNNAKYYAVGSTVTLAPTDDNYIVTGVSGVNGATIATDKRSFSFTMPSQNVTPTATLIALTGLCGDNATWTMSDADSDGTYETLTISGEGATYDYNATNNRAPWKTDFSPTKLVLASSITQMSIADEADLRLLSACVNAGNPVTGKTFRQTADITLNGDFDPIGVGSSTSTMFNGSYDGGGFTISGLSVNTDNYYVGLFGYVRIGTVNNVRLISPTITSSRNGEAVVGAMIGMTGNVHVENCWVYKPTVSTTGSGTKTVGAIIGLSFNIYDVLTNLYYYDDTHNYATIGGYASYSANHYAHKPTRVARVRKVTVSSSGISVSTDASDPVNGFTYGGNKYYREGLELTVGVTNQNTAISSLSTGDGGPSYTLSTDGKSATMSVGDADFTITATLITTSGKTGSVNWALTDEDGNGIYETMTISGTGAMENYRTVSETPWWNFRKDIKSLIVKDGVTGIGTRACTTIGLTTIELPATITSIEGYAFASCSSLTSIEIPASVTRIGESAFSGCTKLASVTIYAPSLESYGNLGNYMFDNNASGRKIYVFSDCVDTYKNTWNAYKNAFEPITLTANEGATGEYWTTYYNDMADAKAPEGTQVFKASLDGTALTLTPIADGIITRGQAVVLKSTSTSIQPDHSATASADGYSDNDLQGTMKRIENLGDAYVLNKKDSHGVGFYKLSATEHIGAHEAYLLLPAATAPDPIPMVVTLTLADDADNTPALANGMTANVTLQGRTLYKDGDWNTICLPFDVTLAGSPLAGATVKKFNASTSGVQESTLILNFDDETTTLYAGVPYLIKWEKASDYVDDNAHNLVNPVFTGVTINSTASTEVTTIDGKVTFQGTYDRKVWNEEDKSVLFVGLNSTLYWPKANGHVNACRAYFQLNDGLTIGSGVTTARMNFEDETTSLSEKGIVNSEKFATATGWYDMSGRKIEGKPTKAGLYLHNGRKTVIK